MLFKLIYSKKGFSLVEIITAIFILGILLAAMVPLISLSLENITNSGERSKALFAVQGSMEKRIGNEEVYKGGRMTAEFTNVSPSPEIDGGIIDEIENLTTFLPNVPTIALEKDELAEGYPAQEIDITGTNTHFSSSTQLRIIDKNNNDVTSINTLDIGDETHVTLNLAQGLTNANSPYIIKLTTGTEVVRALLTITLPNYVTVGDKYNNKSTILVSSNANNWLDRVNGSFPVKEDFNSVARAPDRFVAVGNNGEVICLSDGNDWRKSKSGVNVNLNSVKWNSNMFMFISVGDDGTVIKSSDGITWEEENIAVDTTIDLKDIAITKVDDVFKIIAVGKKNEKGVLVSYDSDTETPIMVEKGHPINSVVWGGVEGNEKFVAVGNGGTILNSENGELWTEKHITQDSIIGIPGLDMWLRADEITDANDGDPITIWDDISGNENDAIIDNNNNKPVYESDGLNGMPVVQFDGVDDVLVSEYFASIIGDKNRSVFMIIVPESDEGEQILITWGKDESNNDGDLWTLGLNNGYIMLAIGDEKKNESFTSTLKPILNRENILGVVLSDNHFKDHKIYLNDLPPQSPDKQNRKVDTATDTFAYIGNDPSGEHPFKGGIAEITIFDRQLTNEELSTLYQYFNHKYYNSINLNSVTWGGAGFLAVGDNGTILSSLDGETWTSQTSETSVDLNGITWSGSQYVIVGDGGVILTSSNGEDWTTRQAGKGYNLNDVTF